MDYKKAAAAKSLQSCPTLCDPIDGSPPGSPFLGILQVRTLKWVVISFFNVWKWKVKVKSLSCVRLFATPWTAGYQAPPSMRFSRQEYWSGLPLPSPRKAEHQRINAFELWSWRRLLRVLWSAGGIQSVHPKGNQSWIFIGRTDAKAEIPILWPPDVKNWLIGKDPDAGKDWRQEKGITKDKIVGWHQWLNGHEPA